MIVQPRISKARLEQAFLAWLNDYDDRRETYYSTEEDEALPNEQRAANRARFLFELLRGVPVTEIAEA